MERLQGSPSILGWNDSRGVILSWDRTTTGVPFYPRIERLQRSPSVLGWNDSRGVILYWDGTTPGETFSACETTPGDLFCPGIERPQGSHCFLG